MLGYVRSTTVTAILLLFILLYLLRDVLKPSPSRAQLNGTMSYGRYSNGTQRERHYPDALVIGVSKCGSTALMYFIDLHPLIKTIKGEIEFLTNYSNYRRGLDYYYSKIPRTRNEKVLIERDGTCWRRGFQERVRQTYDKINPDVKLLLVVCEPVNRVISWYTNSLAHNTSLPPIEKLVINETTSEINTEYDGIKAAVYDRYFPLWLDYFPRDRIHVTDGDKLKTDPYYELHRVETFLGLEHFISRNHLVYNETKGFYCKSVTGRGVRCMGSHKGRPHPVVDPHVIEKLQRYFKPHNKAFEKMTGQTFDW